MRDAGTQEGNLEAARGWVERAADRGAQVICLQELFDGPYPCQAEDHRMFDLAQSIPGPATEAMAEVAKRREVVIVAPIFERRAAGVYHNSAAVLDADGSIAGVYRKMHIPDDPLYYEKFYFAPGDLGFEPIDTSIGRLGVLVCWDQWYPEAARLMALAGAELLLYPTAIGYDPNDEESEARRQLDAWRIIQRSHAVANGLVVASVNRVGFEPDRSGGTYNAEFWGHSFVCGPQGDVLAEAGTSSEVVVCTIDPKRSETVRRIWPFFRDRRIDAYDDLVRRFRI